MNKKSAALFMAALLAASAPLGARAFQQTGNGDRDVVRISAQLVQIDVLVTDKSNRPVTGLQREDFEIYDNNKAQHITHFAYESSKVSSISSDLNSSPAGLPRALTASEVKRVIAFVVDTLHMKPESVYR